jgi:hypothetical protein
MMEKKSSSFGSRTVPRKVVLAVFACLILLLTHFLAFKIGEFFQGAPPPRPTAKVVGAPIRVPLFIDPALVCQQSRFHFTFDSPQTLADLRRTLGVEGVVASGKNQWEKVNLWMNWVRSQWQPGRPDPYPPIDARIILERIHGGVTGGFCAQYNYVFVQGLQSLGMAARYVTIHDHEVTEVWIEVEQRWVCCDPLFRCHYADLDGKSLSVLDIRQAVENGRPVSLVGGQGVNDLGRHLRQFLGFAVWLKNDHIASPINFIDIERYKVYFLETEAERSLLPANALFTFFPEDLYGSPADHPAGEN